MSGESTEKAPEENVEVPIEEVANDQAAEVTLEAEIQGFAEEAPANTDRVAELEAELAEMKSKWMRAVAEEQNVRRRGEREKQDALKYGVTNFAREMVSVADNLRRALESAAEELKDSDLVKGVEMTERELQSAFAKAGIKRIEAQGQPFDHNLHQAMYEIQDPSQPSGLVGQVMQDGYVIHDRLLRPSMVGVTKGGPKYEAPVEGEEAPAAEEAPKEEAAAASEAYENAGAESGEKLDQQS